MAPVQSRRRPAYLCHLQICIATAAPSILFNFSGAMALSTIAASAPSTAALRRRVSTRVVAIPEDVWRQSASEHTERIRSLLSPGLTSLDDPINSGSRRRLRREGRRNANANAWTALDKNNPVFNFLIEYYGLKGAKGPRRLARWSPDPALLLLRDEEVGKRGFERKGAAIESVCDVGPAGGVLLEGATEEDLVGTLHLRGAIPTLDGSGIFYSPALFYNRYPFGDEKALTSDERMSKMKAAAPFQWYQSIISNTLVSEPIFHCHGLHEWAMQYHPPGATPPPSGKYQAHLPLRVSREIINSTVERKGIHCTHVDALRFFAPAAGPLNHHGAQLERTDQLRLEQKGCVHASMDLLKMSLRLAPFVDSSLVADTLDMALSARRLDIEASPYDVKSSYGLGVVPVETAEGREEYRRRQKELMHIAEPLRKRLNDAYDNFLVLAFEEEILSGANRNPAPERFAKAEPGSKPWRKNLID